MTARSARPPISVMVKGSAAETYSSAPAPLAIPSTVARSAEASRSPRSHAPRAANRPLERKSARRRSSSDRYALRDESARPSSARTMGHGTMATSIARCRTIVWITRICWKSF
jgi:hypothetical protein